MPTGVTISHQGRVFVNFPRWGDHVLFTVAEIRNGRAFAYPDEPQNVSNTTNLAEALISVQSVVVDPADRLWILDTGSPNFQPTQYGGPKILCVDLETDQVIKKILFPQDVTLPTTYLNDVRFDLRQGRDGVAYITDSSQKGPNGIIIVDLFSGESWRQLNDHPSTKAESIHTFMPVLEGRPFIQRQQDGSVTPAADMGVDGIAISADGERLYYCPLASRSLYSVKTGALRDRSISKMDMWANVINEGDKGGASDGLESDNSGTVYCTNYEDNAIFRRNTEGVYDTVVHDPRLLWPDTLSLATDGYLYVTANQLHRRARYNGGNDMRVKPYCLFRINVRSSQYF